MARKAAKLTPRQRQSQQIMRDKAARKKRKALMRKLILVGGGAFCTLLVSGGLWTWKSGAALRTANAIVRGGYQLTGQAGFTVQALYLEGRNRTALGEIEKALGVKKGDPILELSLGEIRDRLAAVESIKFAAVERSLPHTLYVRIVEREPVALWQNQGKLALVDDNGAVMNDLDIAPYKQLPLIIGEDAPQHIGELMAILGTEPQLARRFVAAIRLGDRRWNIRLSSAEGTIDIKLPESNPSDAWKKLAELAVREQLLDRNVKVIDLRLEGKMFIKVAPEDMPGKATTARET
jgi:cell division protein FtsQ